MSANDRQVGGDHYRKHAIQPWDAMKEWMPPMAFQGFLHGNAIKYLARAEDKGGLEDLKKARHYLDKLIEEREMNCKEMLTSSGGVEVTPNGQNSAARLPRPLE